MPKKRPPTQLDKHFSILVPVQVRIRITGFDRDKLGTIIVKSELASASWVDRANQLIRSKAIDLLREAKLID